MPVRIPSFDVDAVSRRYGADPSVLAAVRTASVQTGTQFETLLASAAIESGLQPTAQASTSSASGLFQFTEQTWLSTIRRYGAEHGLAAEAAAVVQRGGQLQVEDPAIRQRILNLRQDPAVSSMMAGEHMRDLADQIGTSIGHAPDAGELYLGHFLGGGGASQMLSALQSTPSRPAAEILPDAARANQTMFYAKDGTPYTVAQFVDRVRNRVAKAFTDIGSSMPSGPVNLTSKPVAGRTPDAPDSGASGWGISTPRRIASTAERTMAATLADVFIRADNTMQRARNTDNRHEHALPQAVLSALQS